jgi:hypothetical protein
VRPSANLHDAAMPQVHPGRIVLALLLAAAHLRAQESAAPERSGGEAFAFAWPVPCSAVVTKDGEKKGARTRLRFRLDLAAGEAGELRVKLGDFEFLLVDGQDATTPAMREALAPASALTQAVPDTVVSAKGDFLRIDGIDAMLERVAKFMGETKGHSAEEQARILASMRTPVMQQVLQEACSADWITWAGGWVGFDATPGSDTADVVRMPMMGASLEGAVTRRHLGAVDEHPGHVRLSAKMVAEGPEATAAFAEAMARLAKEAGGPPFPADQLEELRVETTMEVVTDPKTLLPLRAGRTKKMRVVMKGRPAREQVERHDYTFEWIKPPAEQR